VKQLQHRRKLRKMTRKVVDICLFLALVILIFIFWLDN
jgi:hypothetical protein